VVITDAKKLVGNICSICWTDRLGREVQTTSRIHDATFVPLYGGYLITDREEIRLDKIKAIYLVAENGVPIPIVMGEKTDRPKAA
jgi:hypothetical protein